MTRRYVPRSGKPAKSLSTPVRARTAEPPATVRACCARDPGARLQRAALLGHDVTRVADTAVQTKLTLGPTGDRYEQEADSVARQVVRETAAPELAQRQGLDEEELQMKSLPGVEGGPIDADLEASIQRARSGGASLDGGVQSSMESAFGADFSGVRVHSGGNADSLNQSLQARAFTTGQDIFFRQGEYSPASSGGRELLAHELTHVVQQNGNKVLRRA